MPPIVKEEPKPKPTLSLPAESVLKIKTAKGALTKQNKPVLNDFELPSLNLLTNPKVVDQSNIKKDLKKQAEVLEQTMLNFGIEAKVGQINCGPTITSFEVHPAIGVKVQKIKTLENDIALNMEAKSIRIIAPIPGKAAVGIEVPNLYPQEVSFKEILSSYKQAAKKFKIPILLGKTVTGEYVMNDLTKMPHCIIAGATGSGKSVCINTIVMAIIYSLRPDEVKFLMIDPKKVELTPYSKLPHMISPVITESAGAQNALIWMVQEMEKRYEILKQLGVRNIDGFNQRKRDKEFENSLSIEVPEKLPYIVGIIDELADLMMVSAHEIETPIARIAQMARAVGIHLILATQRPSREVITGLIKANFPTRISFKVASRINSQIVLDEVGAETLLGNGDLLFLPPGTSQLIRAQGAYIRDEDINKVVSDICMRYPTNYLIPSFDTLDSSDVYDDKEPQPKNSLLKEAVKHLQNSPTVSTTFLQRKLNIGYPRAASLMDLLEEEGYVSAPDGNKMRKVLKRDE
jgi:S-DNA-T family DNA segregation ATPase FtsK/SpoIIIE